MANTYTDLLKLRMPTLGDIGWDDEVNDNTMIFEFTVAPVLKGNRIVSGFAPSDGGGLDIDVAGGTVVVDGSIYTLSADTKTCTASEKNYLYVDDTGTLQCTTTFPTGSFCAIALIDTDLTSLVRFSDARALAQGALAMAIDYTPDHYTPDTSQDAPIDQHLSGIDQRIEVLGGRKNYWDNYNCEIWQRNTSQSSAGISSIDRHYFGAITSNSRVSVSGISGLRFGFQFGNTGTASPFFDHYILALNAKKLVGKTLTLSFYADNVSGNSGLSYEVRYPTSTDDDFMVTTKLTDGNIWVDDSPPSTMTRYNFTFTVASGCTTGLLFRIYRTSTYSNAFTEMTGFLLEESPCVSALPYQSFEDTLLNCLPYYQKSYDYATSPGSITNVGRLAMYSDSFSSVAYNITGQWHFPALMATMPQIVFYSPTTGSSGVVRTFGSGDTAPSGSTISRSKVEVTALSSATTVRSIEFQATADTGY